jgi:hypothetical protein
MTGVAGAPQTGAPSIKSDSLGDGGYQGRRGQAIRGRDTTKEANRLSRSLMYVRAIA